MILNLVEELRGGTNLTIDEAAPHKEPVEILINDKFFYQAGDLMVPARPTSGIDMLQVASGPGLKPEDERKDKDANKENPEEDNHIDGRSDKVREFDLGALERDLLEYDFKETEGGANETLVLMTPSSFMPPIKETPASLSPVRAMTLM